MQKIKEIIKNLSDTKKRILYYSIVVLIIAGLATGLSFAWFMAIVTGNETAKSTVVETATLSIVYTNTQELKGVNIIPGWSETKTFTVTNTGNATAYYELVWANLTNEMINKSDVLYSITSTNNGGSLTETFVPNTGIDVSIIKNIAIEPGVTQTYTLVVRYNDSGKDQNSDQGKSLTGKIEVKEQSTAFQLPVEYTSVKYLESNRGPVINTGVIPTESTYVECDYEFTEYNGSTASIFGAYATGWTGYNFFAYSTGGSIWFDYGNNDISLGITYDYNRHFVKTYKGIANIDGKDYGRSNAVFGMTMTTPIYLFGTSTSNYLSQSKIYSMKIYNDKNGEIQRYFVPCYRISDHKPGMYDLANDVFYTNVGSGEFILP